MHDNYIPVAAKASKATAMNNNNIPVSAAAKIMLLLPLLIHGDKCEMKRKKESWLENYSPTDHQKET